MTQIAAIANSLLNGEVLSIMDGFQKFLCTNIPRELSRSIEHKFGVTLSRSSTPFKSQYGRVGVYFKYRLPNTEYNKPGIKKMKAYVKDNSL